VVPKVGGSSPLGHPSADQRLRDSLLAAGADQVHAQVFGLFCPDLCLHVEGTAVISDQEPTRQVIVVATDYTDAEQISSVAHNVVQMLALVDWLPSSYWGPGAVVWEPVMMPSALSEDGYAASLADDTNSIELNGLRL
jgi:hypothetical protein